MAQQTPNSQARNVFKGIDVSSVFETAARTSGYGESSSKDNEYRLSQTCAPEPPTEAFEPDSEIWVVEPNDVCSWVPYVDRMLFGYYSGLMKRNFYGYSLCRL